MIDWSHVLSYAVIASLLGWVPVTALLHLILIAEVKPGEHAWRSYAGFFRREQLRPLGQKILPIYRFMTWAWIGGIIAVLLGTALWDLASAP